MKQIKAYSLKFNNSEIVIEDKHTAFKVFLAILPLTKASLEEIEYSGDCRIYRTVTREESQEYAEKYFYKKVRK